MNPLTFLTKSLNSFTPSKKYKLASNKHTHLERMLLTNVLIARYTFNAYGVVIVPVIVAVTLLNREQMFSIYTGM